MAEATKTELNKFVEVVDKFMRRYATLNSPATREQVYASNDQKLISDYETAVSRGGALKIAIEKTVGAWNAAKRAWKSITDTTSTVIGDAIDEIRSWFGRSATGDLGRYSYAGLSGLGAIQVPAAAWVAGIIAAAVILTKAIDEILVRVEATRIQRESGLPREQAIALAKDVYSRSLLGDVLDWKIIAAVALAAYFIWGSKK